MPTMRARQRGASGEGAVGRVAKSMNGRGRAREAKA